MNKLFSSAQIKAWDQYTIEHEPISSIELMELAAQKCVLWLINKWKDTQTHFVIICGAGNNGGDGLAIARLLLLNNFQVNIVLISSESRSQDNAKNLQNLISHYPECVLNANDDWQLNKGSIIIDAIFGIGLNRQPQGIEKKLIRKINASSNTCVSIDIPSGLPADYLVDYNDIVEANYTLSFQQYKLSFLFPESGNYCGEIVLLDIMLHPEFVSKQPSSNFVLDKLYIQSIYKKRLPFSHKGTYGHALIVAGSHHKMGACTMALKACLRSGAGLVTAYIHESENQIVQIAVPEAMTETYTSSRDYELLSFEKYDAIGIGCGLGTDHEAEKLLNKILSNCQKPILLDADALIIISKNIDLLNSIPKGSVITPHPKEFDRLFGVSSSTYERNQLQIKMGIKHQIYIVLKGRYTAISTPQGETYFNLNGNPGMATGGSGDVLSGIVTGLYAQYHDMKIASLIGVYLHGLSGDIASNLNTEESLIATDIIDCLGSAFAKSFKDSPTS